MPDSGLSLVCTPGNDVEAVTGLVAAGVNVVLFSTGLGTPTGNPIVPVIKAVSYTHLDVYKRQGKSPPPCHSFTSRPYAAPYRTTQTKQHSGRRNAAAVCV